MDDEARHAFEPERPELQKGIGGGRLAIRNEPAHSSGLDMAQT
jgi:hypothetical protein